MFDPLLSLLAAKAKAVGLVAGTAMVAAAMAGGGAVAMTAVSHDGTLDEHEATIEETLDPTDPLVTDDVSDSNTVVIDPVVPEEDDDAAKTPPALPEGFVCDETKNHGQNVSAYARSLPKGPGRGEKVSAVAQSDCGKSAGEEETADTEPVEEETGELGTASTEEPKADKPAKPVKADKPAKAEKPAKAQKPAKADKPAKAQGKPEGKGGGRG